MDGTSLFHEFIVAKFPSANTLESSKKEGHMPHRHCGQHFYTMRDIARTRIDQLISLPSPDYLMDTIYITQSAHPPHGIL
jgi:hypothetical protein